MNDRQPLSYCRNRCWSCRRCYRRRCHRWLRSSILLQETVRQRNLYIYKLHSQHFGLMLCFQISVIFNGFIVIRINEIKATH